MRWHAGCGAKSVFQAIVLLVMHLLNRKSASASRTDSRSSKLRTAVRKAIYKNLAEACALRVHMLEKPPRSSYY